MGRRTAGSARGVQPAPPPEAQPGAAVDAGAQTVPPVQLVEVFSSVQGEGPEVGARTLFVRFAECDLRCAWCDTPHSWTPGRTAQLERTPGAGDFEARGNPLAFAAVLEAVERLQRARAHRFISLTGGEPLLQPEAVAALSRALAGRGARVLLETHGLHRAALALALPHLDVVSMDWKFASDVRRREDEKRACGAGFHDAHEAFLETAVRAGSARVVVKFVITPNTGDAEVREALSRVARTAPAASLVLQPVTPFGAQRERPSAARMLALETLAAARHADVRVIPQTHPVWNAR